MNEAASQSHLQRLGNSEIPSISMSTTSVCAHGLCLNPTYSAWAIPRIRVA